MEKDEIADLICEKNESLIRWLQEQDEEKWQTGPNKKWTTGQQVLHLLQSTKALNGALSLPKFILRSRFGKTNRPLRSYERVVSRYKERLESAKGTTFKASKNMKIPPLKDKLYLLNRLQVEHKKLEYKTRKISDQNLDQLVIPHPLLGKMPIREILMWSAYHIEHHTNQLKSNY